jgi:hypothetical protein
MNQEPLACVLSVRNTVRPNQLDWNYFAASE